MKILLTGAGSLVARGIHDALAGRDDGLEIIGANLHTDDPTALRCSRVHAVPSDSEPAALTEALIRITELESPDLVLPCRDPHIPILAALDQAGPCAGRVGVGPPALARIMVDKWAAHQWCSVHRVPFAPSVLAADPQAPMRVQGIVRDFGFPLIGKPRKGSGSLGVRVMNSWDQVNRALALPDMLLQPFLDPPDSARTDIDTTLGVPLFWEIPVSRTFAGQFLVGPDGELGPSMQMFARQRLGRNEYLAPWHDPELQRLMERAVAALAEEGWRGPVNVQARPHKGRWYIIEFGGRFSGGTSQRTWLGFDEVGWIINRWAREEVVPPLSDPPALEVPRYLADSPVWNTSDGLSLTPPGHR